MGVLTKYRERFCELSQKKLKVELTVCKDNKIVYASGAVTLIPIQFVDLIVICYENLKPGSHEQRKHKLENKALMLL